MILDVWKLCIVLPQRKRVLGFPPGQRWDGGVDAAAGVADLRVGGERRLLLVLLLAVRVIHRQRDERGGLPVMRI